MALQNFYFSPLYVCIQTEGQNAGIIGNFSSTSDRVVVTCAVKMAAEGSVREKVTLTERVQPVCVVSELR